uniref:CCHC-type domain-containing protein n=1 Tax=Ditylenchus dipsaci TaxID=166011 RepID=A0A915CSD0_9BILA
MEPEEEGNDFGLETGAGGWRQKSGDVHPSSSFTLHNTCQPIHYASSSAAQLVVAKPEKLNDLNKGVYLIDYINKNTADTLLKHSKPISVDLLCLRLLIPNKFVEDIQNQTSLKKFEELSAELQLSEWKWPETVLSVFCPQNQLKATLELLVHMLRENEEVKLLLHHSHATALREMKTIKVFRSRCPKSTDNVVFAYGEKNHLLGILHQVISLTQRMPNPKKEQPYNPINFDKWSNKEYGGYAHFQAPNDLRKTATLNSFVPWRLANLIETQGVKAVKNVLWLKNVQIKVDKLKKAKERWGMQCGGHWHSRRNKGVVFVLKQCLEKSDTGKYCLNYLFQPTCSNCTQKGHFSRHCTQPLYCTKCTGKRHLVEDCIQLKAAAKSLSKKQETIFVEDSMTKKSVKVNENSRRSNITESLYQNVEIGEHSMEESPQNDSAPVSHECGNYDEETYETAQSKENDVNWI